MDSRFDRLPVIARDDGAAVESPIVTAGVVETHLHAVVFDGFGQFADDVALRLQMLLVRVDHLAGPEREALVMLAGEHDIARARRL